LNAPEALPVSSRELVLRHSFIPPKEKPTQHGVKALDGTEREKAEGRIMKSNHDSFECFRMVTKIAVNSSHSARNGWSLSGETIFASTSSSSQ